MDTETPPIKKVDTGIEVAGPATPLEVPPEVATLGPSIAVQHESHDLASVTQPGSEMSPARESTLATATDSGSIELPAIPKISDEKAEKWYVVAARKILEKTRFKKEEETSV